MTGGKWEEKNFSEKRTTSASHVRWVLREKSFRLFRPNGDFCPVGTEGRKFEDLSFKTARTVKGVLERKNLQNLLTKMVPRVRWVVEGKIFKFFWPNGDFCPVGTEGKKISKSFVQNRQNPPVGSGEKKFSETVSFGPPPRLPDEGTKIFFKILRTKRPLMTGGK